MALYVVGNHNHNLAQRYAKKLNATALTYTTTHFADTEMALSFSQNPELSKANVLFIHQYDGTKDINNQLMELLMVATHLRMRGADNLIGFLPYLPYTRQTKTVGHTLPSTPIFQSLIKAAGINHLVAADIHEHSEYITGIQQGISINCGTWWAEIIRTHFGKELGQGRLCLIAPDKGAVPYITALAKLLDVPTAFVTKQRLHQDRATALSVEGNVKGLHTIIVDDIVDTGHTAIGAYNLLHAHKALSVSACFTHGVLSPGALDRLTGGQLKQIFITNTLRERPLLHPHITSTDIHDFLAAQVSALLPTLLPKE